MLQRNPSLEMQLLGGVSLNSWDHWAGCQQSAWDAQAGLGARGRQEAVAMCRDLPLLPVPHALRARACFFLGNPCGSGGAAYHSPLPSAPYSPEMNMSPMSSRSEPFRGRHIFSSRRFFLSVARWVWCEPTAACSRIGPAQ